MPDPTKEAVIERMARAIYESRRDPIVDPSWEELLAEDANTPDEKNIAYFKLTCARNDATAAYAIAEVLFLPMVEAERERCAKVADEYTAAIEKAEEKTRGQLAGPLVETSTLLARSIAADIRKAPQ